MSKLVTLLIVLVIGGNVIIAATISEGTSPSECVPELSRFDVRGTAQRRSYKLQQNKKQRIQHKNHVAKHGGKLMYFQEYELHIEALLTDNQKFRLFLSDEDQKSKQLPNLWARVGVVDQSQRYIYFKLKPSSNTSIFEAQLPNRISTQDLELDLRFSGKISSKVKRVTFDILSQNK